MSFDFPNDPPDSTLTPQQQQVLTLLAEGSSFSVAAQEAGVHRNTIRNWRRTIPAFAREYEFSLREQCLVWHERAVELAPRAAQVLDEILNDPDTKAALRLRVALAILKTAASPRPEIFPALPSLDAKLETAWGRYLARQSNHADVHVHAKNEESCTIVHNGNRQPGRNSVCPCGSKKKYKRCCGSNIAELVSHRPIAGVPAPPEQAQAAR